MLDENSACTRDKPWLAEKRSLTALFAAFAGMPLRVLSLSSCRLGSSHIKELSDSLTLHPNLAYLNISKNRLSGKALRRIGKMLSTNTKLTHLDISANSLGGSITAQSIEFIYRAPCLQFLDLSENQLREAAVEPLLHLLENGELADSKLVEINLCRNQLFSDTQDILRAVSGQIRIHCDNPTSWETHWRYRGALLPE